MILKREPVGVGRPAKVGIARGLQRLILPGTARIDATGAPITFQSATVVGRDSFGPYYQFSGSGSEQVSLSSGIGGATNASLLLVQKCTDDATNSGWHCCDTSSLGNHFVYFGSFYTSALATSRWVSGISAPSGNSLTDLVSLLVTMDSAGNGAIYWNGVLWTSASGLTCGPNATLQFGLDATSGLAWCGKLYAAATWNRALTAVEAGALCRVPQLDTWQLFAPPRRIWVQLAANEGTGGTTTNERTVAARTKARGAATTTAIHAATTAGRIRARAADVVVPIHVETVAGRVTARGADARTSIHAGTAAGRIKARGTDTVAPLRTESAAGRIRAKATNTVEHIDAGAVSRTIAGKVRARGAAATLAIRHTSIVGRVQARGADTVTSTRLSLAAGRVRTRAAIAAAPVVAGMVVTTAAGRIQARGAIATTATRIEAIAGRVTARGTDTANSIRTAVTAGRLRSRGRATAGPYVAPTLPLEIPPSTRTIDRDPTRLGRSPLSPTKPRLG